MMEVRIQERSLEAWAQETALTWTSDTCTSLPERVSQFIFLTSAFSSEKMRGLDKNLDVLKLFWKILSDLLIAYTAKLH